MKTEKSCGVVIYRETSRKNAEFLLLRYAVGHWSLCKGHVEHGETEEQTALREVLEETGIDGLRLKRGRKFQTSYEIQRPEGKTHKTVVFFISRVTVDTKVVLTKEHLDYQWLTLNKAKLTLTYETDRQVLDWASKNIVDCRSN